MNELTPAQQRIADKNEFQRKYGQHWLVYAALILTATLSTSAGLLMPFQPDANGYVLFTVPRLIAAIFYAIGFLTTGELAANYWFEKLTDRDKDNTTQKYIAIIALFAAVVTSLVTSLAAGAMVAFMLGVLDAFQIMPVWAQEWIVWAIPTMWIMHAVAGMAFKATSDEAVADRNAASIISAVKSQIVMDKANARAEYWKANAPRIAQELGKLEAEHEIDAYSVKLNKKPQQPMRPAYAANAPKAELDEKPSPTSAGE